MAPAASPAARVRRHPMTDADVMRIADAADEWARDAMVARLVARLAALATGRGRVPRDWREGDPPCTGGDA